MQSTSKKILISIIIATLSMSSFASGTPTTAGTSTSATATPTSKVTVAKGVDCGAGTACFVVSDTSNRAIDLINNDASRQMTNVVTSQFDFTLMTKYAMGTNWKQATPAQQAQLVILFKQLLISTYSTALSKFKGAKTNIVSTAISTPNPQNPAVQKTAVVCQITLPNSTNNAPIKVEYNLANNTGRWLAYDIKIENASLVTTYRTQFNDIVQSSKIPGLIKQLQDKVNTLQRSKSDS
jgi:phospholipid transport system substrate-binding protein